MSVSYYWVGQIPARPISITVRDSRGALANLSQYSSFRVRILGSDNEDIDTTGSFLSTSGANEGKLIFYFPTDRSLFTQDGEYVLQVELENETSKDFTTEHYIKVRKLGGIN